MTLRVLHTLVPAILLAAGLILTYLVALALGAETVSVTFLLGFPIFAGAAILFLRPKGMAPGLVSSILWQGSIVAMSFFGVWALNLEGLICIAMAVGPILFGTLLGGLLYVMVLRWRASDPGSLSVLTLPLIAALAIDAIPHEPQIITTRNSIIIDAPADQVFARLQSIPDIQPEEIPTRFTHLLGVPKPTAARWEDTPTGPIRHSHWGPDVHFLEEITQIVPNQSIAWNFTFPNGWAAEGIEDPHITVGGPYLDILTGAYHLDDLGDQTRLTLETRSYDGSGFGAYARFWHHVFIEDFHEVILHLVKTRTEASHPL